MIINSFSSKRRVFLINDNNIVDNLMQSQLIHITLKAITLSNKNK